MKAAVIAILVASVLAAPCIYEISSKEPSPLVGLIDASRLGQEPLPPTGP